MNLNDVLHPQKRQEYTQALQEQGYSPATIARKTASLNQLDSWAKERGYVNSPTTDTLISTPQPPSPLRWFTRKRIFIGITAITGITAIVIFLLVLNLPGALNLGTS